MACKQRSQDCCLNCVDNGSAQIGCPGSICTAIMATFLLILSVGNIPAPCTDHMSLVSQAAIWQLSMSTWQCNVGLPVAALIAAGAQAGVIVSLRQSSEAASDRQQCDDCAIVAQHAYHSHQSGRKRLWLQDGDLSAEHA